MTASGDQIAPIPMTATGITVPPGTPLTVEFTGSITRARTAGVEQFCQLPAYQGACATAWADILRTTPITADGSAGLGAALVSWDNGSPVSPDSGASTALEGPSGGELWAGRSGFQCWYVDIPSGLQGACFTFGGSYTATLATQGEVTSAGGDPVELELVVLSADVGPGGGTVRLAAQISGHGPSGAALGNGDEPPPHLGFTRWYFLPDVRGESAGTPEPSPFEISANLMPSGPARPSVPVRLDDQRVLLPNGRIVGSGLHVFSEPASIKPDEPTMSFMSIASRMVNYDACDALDRCTMRYEAPSGTFVVVSSIDGQPVSASWRVAAATQQPLVTIVRAAGPNDGSFTTRSGENRISLQAVVAGTSIPQVTWEIEDDPTDRIRSDPPEGPITGPVASFVVPRSNEDTLRKVYAHRGEMIDKAIRYRVTAIARVGGREVRSEQVTVGQDERDALRQEYIDRRKATIPPREQLGRQGDQLRNTGDYSVWPASPRLVARMPILQALAAETFGRPITVTGGFRNPVHHHVHEKLKSRESQHIYGAATDFRIWDNPKMTKSQYFFAIRSLAWDISVEGCFEPEAVIRAASTDRDLTHAHIDWRPTCPAGWGA